MLSVPVIIAILAASGLVLIALHRPLARASCSVSRRFGRAPSLQDIEATTLYLGVANAGLAATILLLVVAPKGVDPYVLAFTVNALIVSIFHRQLARISYPYHRFFGYKGTAEGIAGLNLVLGIPFVVIGSAILLAQLVL